MQRRARRAESAPAVARWWSWLSSEPVRTTESQELLAFFDELVDRYGAALRAGEGGQSTFDVIVEVVPTAAALDRVTALLGEIPSEEVFLYRTDFSPDWGAFMVVKDHLLRSWPAAVGLDEAPYFISGDAIGIGIGIDRTEQWSPELRGVDVCVLFRFSSRTGV